MRIVEIGLGTASYAAALDYAQAYLISFRQDPIGWGGRPLRYQFRADDMWKTTMAERDPKRRLKHLVNTARNFSDAVHLLAWDVLEFVSTPGSRSFIGYDNEDGAGDQPAVIATWTCPPQLVTLGWKEWFQWWTTKLRVRFHKAVYWLLGYGTYPLFSSEVYSKIYSCYKICGYLSTPERLHELERMSESQLDKTGYTITTAYDLSLFGSAVHRKGLGSQLLGHTLKQLEPKTVQIGSRTLPPRLSIIATPAGQGLYAKFGFVPLKTAEVPLTESSKDNIILTLMTLKASH